MYYTPALLSVFLHMEPPARLGAGASRAAGHRPRGPRPGGVPPPQRPAWGWHFLPPPPLRRRRRSLEPRLLRRVIGKAVLALSVAVAKLEMLNNAGLCWMRDRISFAADFGPQTTPGHNSTEKMHPV